MNTDGARKEFWLADVRCVGRKISKNRWKNVDEHAKHGGQPKAADDAENNVRGAHGRRPTDRKVGAVVEGTPDSTRKLPPGEKYVYVEDERRGMGTWGRCPCRFLVLTRDLFWAIRRR